METPFLGPFDVSRSTNASDNQLINLYPEVIQTGAGKAKAVLYMTPGLDLFGTAGTGPIRGAHVMAGVLFVVSGNQVFSVSTTGTATLIGAIGTSTGPVSMIDNGTQLFFVDGSTARMVTGGVLSLIALPFANPVTCCYQDGFGLVSFASSQNFAQSNLKDMSTWAALNFSVADAHPDNIVALAEMKREVFVLKEFSTEIWIDAGLAGFAFQRLDGVFIELGCCAAFSPAITAEATCWLARNTQGQAVAVMASGYEPRRISTNALETRWAGYSTVADSIGFSYQQEGHVFYNLTFPTGNESWTYDVTASALAQTPMWHQRAAFASGNFTRHPANCFAFYNGKQIVGDFASGKLYALNLNTQLDNGAQRKWVRSWRALPKPTMDPVRFSQLSIDMQTGMGVDPAANPQVMLRWTDDGGHNWSNSHLASAGQTGQTTKRVKFTRLGSTRRNSGLDRIFELSSSDAFNVALIGADLK